MHTCDPSTGEAEREQEDYKSKIILATPQDQGQFGLHKTLSLKNKLKQTKKQITKPEQ